MTGKKVVLTDFNTSETNGRTQSATVISDSADMVFQNIILCENYNTSAYFSLFYMSFRVNLYVLVVFKFCT